MLSPIMPAPAPPATSAADRQRPSRPVETAGNASVGVQPEPQPTPTGAEITSELTSAQQAGQAAGQKLVDKLSPAARAALRASIEQGGEDPDLATKRQVLESSGLCMAPTYGSVLPEPRRQQAELVAAYNEVRSLLDQ